MALQISSQEDADIEEVLRVQHVAFRHKDPGIGRILSPDPVPTDDYITASAVRRRKKMQENEAGRYMKVVETSTNKIIACAHWDIYPKERTQEQIEQITHITPPPPDVNPEVWNDFFGYLRESRKELGTQPIAILFTLTTHPDHHRRGAGGILLERMMEEVDREGLPAYLESSEMGKPLYKRFGFEEVRTTEFKLEKYGGHGSEKNTVMLRAARPKA
jgi:GNAT superfamily N-acetyltransferase